MQTTDLSNHVQSTSHDVASILASILGDPGTTGDNQGISSSSKDGPSIVASILGGGTSLGSSDPIFGTSSTSNDGQPTTTEASTIFILSAGQQTTLDGVAMSAGFDSDSSSAAAVVAGQTVHAGIATTVSNIGISVNSNGVVIVSQASAAITTQNTSLYQVLAIGSQTFTVSDSGGAEILANDQTTFVLSAGGAQMTINNQVMSAGVLGGIVVDGTIVATDPPGQVTSTTTGRANVFALSSKTWTLSNLSNGLAVVYAASTTFTLSPGGPAVSNGSAVFSEAANGTVVACSDSQTTTATVQHGITLNATSAGSTVGTDISSNSRTALFATNVGAATRQSRNLSGVFMSLIMSIVFCI